MAAAQTSGRNQTAPGASHVGWYGGPARNDANRTTIDEAFRGWMQTRQCGCFSCRAKNQSYARILDAVAPGMIEQALVLLD